MSFRFVREIIAKARNVNAQELELGRHVGSFVNGLAIIEKPSGDVSGDYFRHAGGNPLNPI